MKLARPAIAAAAVLALTLIGASPAMAIVIVPDPGPVAVLPSTQALFALACDDQYPDNQLLGVDPTTAVSTPVGTGTAGETGACDLQAAYNPVTNKAYYSEYHGNTLMQIDLATGVSTPVGVFSDEEVTVSIEAIAIGLDGSAYALANNEIYSLNLATAGVAYIADTNISAYAFSVDPTTGNFYAIDTDGNIYSITVLGAHSIDIEPAGLVYENKTTNFSLLSLQIDSAGIFWVQMNTGEDSPVGADAGLWNFTRPSGDTIVSPSLVGYFTDDYYYTESILIAPAAVAPVLAKTGTDLSGVPLIAGFAALLVLGGVLVARRRTV